MNNSKQCGGLDDPINVTAHYLCDFIDVLQCDRCLFAFFLRCCFGQMSYYLLIGLKQVCVLNILMFNSGNEKGIVVSGTLKYIGL